MLQHIAICAEIVSEGSKLKVKDAQHDSELSTSPHTTNEEKSRVEDLEEKAVEKNTPLLKMRTNC